MTRDQMMILLLMADAAVVAIGLSRKKNMWLFIVVYWLLLTIKNTMNFASMM